MAAGLQMGWKLATAPVVMKVAGPLADTLPHELVLKAVWLGYEPGLLSFNLTPVKLNESNPGWYPIKSLKIKKEDTIEILYPDS